MASMVVTIVDASLTAARTMEPWAGSSPPVRPESGFLERRSGPCSLTSCAAGPMISHCSQGIAHANITTSSAESTVASAIFDADIRALRDEIAAFANAQAIRITTTVRSERPSRVALPAGGAITGWALCDEITTLYGDEPAAEMGGLSEVAMTTINNGLMAALGIPHP